MSYASYAKVFRPAPERSYAELGMGPTPPKTPEDLGGLTYSRGSYAKVLLHLTHGLTRLTPRHFGSQGLPKRV